MRITTCDLFVNRMWAFFEVNIVTRFPLAFATAKFTPGKLTAPLLKRVSSPANPIARVKLLKVPKRTERILTREEEYQLLAACSQVHAPLLRASVLIGLNTGMRKGEIHRLKWEHADLRNRLITIYNGKTSESDRPIPMNAVVYELLSNLWQQRKGEFVFPSPRKKGERFRDPKVGFLKAVRLAKIPHIRFHDLRHTFATRLVYAGVDIVTVQHLLGHSNIKMTSRYAHPLADAKIEAVKRLDFAGDH